MAFRPLVVSRPQLSVAENDYTRDLNPNTILKDPRFHADYKAYRERHGVDTSSWTEQDLIDDFYQHRIWRNFNTVSIGKDLLEAHTADPAQRERLARIQKVWENSPDRGFWDAAPDYVMPLLADPLNFAAPVRGLKGAWDAYKVGRGAWAAARAGIQKGAVTGAAEEALVSAVQSTGRQLANEELGLQDEFYQSRLLADTLTGAAGGGLLGGTLGGVGTAIATPFMRDAAERLTSAGVDMTNMGFIDAYRRSRDLPSPSEAAASGQTPDPAVFAIRDADRDPLEMGPQEALTPAAPEQIDTPEEAMADTIDPAIARAARERAEAQLDRWYKEGQSPAMIAQAQRNVVRMHELEKLAQIIDNMRKNTDVLLASDNLKNARTGQQNAQRIVELESLYRRLLEDPSVATLKEASRAREMVMGDITHMPEVSDADLGLDAGAASARAADAPQEDTPDQPDAPTAAEAIAAENPAGTPATPSLPDEEQVADLVPAPQAVTPEPAPVARAADADGERVNVDDLDELEAYADILDATSLVEDHPQYREIVARIAQETYPQYAKAILSRLDRDLASSGDELGQIELARITSDMSADDSANALRGFLGALVKRAAVRRGANERVADRTAQRAIEGDRGQGTPSSRRPRQTTSPTGRAADALATGYTTAGRNTDGSVQSILRPGRATEKDAEGAAVRTITDGRVPYRRDLPREAVEHTAIAKGEITPWVTNAPMRGVIGARNAQSVGKGRVNWGHVDAGTIVFFEPRTGRWYADEATAMKAAGAIPPGTLDDTLRRLDIERVDVEVPEAGEAPRPARQTTPANAAPGEREVMAGLSPEARDELVRKLLAGEIDKDTFFAALTNSQRLQDAASGEPARAARARVVTPPAPQGMRVAIRRKSDPTEVRVLSDGQRARGQGVEAMIGKNGDPEDWEIGFVPEGMKSHSRGVHKQFRPATEDELDAVSGPREDIGPKGIPDTELNNLYANFNVLSDADFEAWNNVMAYLRVQPMAREKVPLSAIEYVRVTLDRASWPVNADAMARHIDHLTTVYRIADRFMPDGIRRSNASKEQAVAEIERIFSKRDPEELAVMRDFIARLAGDEAPHFEEGRPGHQTGFYYTSYSPDPSEVNRVGIGKRDLAMMPHAAATFHEVAHWAYANILSNAERLQFWESVRKYYRQDGRLDMQAVERRTPYIPAGVTGTNTLDSPQEFFANQFVGFVMQKRQTEQWGDRTFWSRIWRYVQAIFDRFFARDFIDADLEPLFARILPDEEEVRFTPFQPSGPLKKPQSKYIVNNLNHINLLHHDLARALQHDQIETALATAQDLAEKLFYLTSRQNTFAPLGSQAKTVRDLAYRISHALGKGVDENGIARLDADDFQYDPDMDDLADAASIWLRDNDHGHVSNPEAAFDALRQLWDGASERADGTTVSATGSIQNVIHYLNTQFNYAFRRNEGQYFSPREVPNTVRPKTVDPEPSAESKQRVRRAKVVKQADVQKVIEDAVRRARTPAAKRADPTGDAPASLRQGNRQTAIPMAVRNADLEDLARTYANTKSRKTKDAIASEILRRQKTTMAPWPEDSVPQVSKAIVAARAPDLDRMLVDAMDNGDGQLYDQVLYEVWRRAENSRRKKSGQPPIRPSIQTPAIKSAIVREQAQFLGEIEDGIPEGVRATDREMMSMMTHRDPEVQETMRTLLYRSLNLMGKTTRNALGEANLLTIGDMHRLANQPIPAGASGSFLDFRDPSFSHLRSSLRRMAIGLTKGVSNPFDAMHEVYHLALRTGVFGEDDLRLIREQFVEAAHRGEKVAVTRLERYAGGKRIDDLTTDELDVLAEEWFAESGAMYSIGKVARGDLFAIREAGDMSALTMKGRLVTLANQLIEAVAYLVNGLIGRKDIKQLFRRLDAYGDMFASNRPNVAPASKRIGVAPEYAAAHTGQALRSMSRHRFARIASFVDGGLSVDENGDLKPYYHGTPLGDAFQHPDVVMMPGRGEWGRGIYLTEDPLVAGEVYANRPTAAAMKKRALALAADGKIKPESLNDVLANVQKLTAVRRDISALMREYASMRSDAPGTGPDTLRMANIRRLGEDDLRGLIEDLRQHEGALVEELDRLGFQLAPDVIATVVRARRPADFRPAAVYAPDSAFVATLADALNEFGSIPDADIQMWRGTLPPEGLRGDALHKSILQLAVRTGAAKNVYEATDLLNEVLGRMGYDSLRAVHMNTLDDGVRVPHQTVVLLDHVDPVTGKRVSSSNLVKNIDASDFDAEDPRMFYSRMANVEAPNGTLVGAMMDGVPTDAPLARSIISKLDADGMPQSMIGAMSSALRQRMPGPKEYGAFKKFATAVLGAQSTRLEQAGMRTLADFHRSHFVDHANLLAKKVYALKDVLAELPDSPSAFRRWLQNSNPLKSPQQPLSHARIVRGLRFGEMSQEYARLTDQEKKVARTVRALLRSEYEEMRRAGVIVGNIPDYFPQVWNTEAIQRDVDGFANKLANYFEAEASSQNRQITREEAVARARNVAARLIDEDGHYVPPPVGTSRTAMSDNIDFQRMIRLDDPEFRANLAELYDYLENDLEGLLVKYFDGTTRRILQTERFGALNHGYFDYLRVIDEGQRGIASLLSTNRVLRKDLKTLDADGYAVMLQFQDETVMPFQGDEAGAMQAAETVTRIFHEEGEIAAKRYLMGLDRSLPDNSPLAPRVSTYEHRVNAIISALRDMGGQPNMVPANEIVFAQDALRAAMRKQVDGGPLGTQGMRNLSRGIRTLNAVTLLSFATLTSLPDMVLPMIGSGSAKAHLRALRNMARDPIYRRMIRNTGVAIESITNQRMASLYGADISGKLGRLNNAFFNATLLTPWTDMNRKIAAAVGFEAFKADIERAVTLKVGDGSNIADQPAEYRRIMRRLQRYGLADFVEQNRQLSIDDMESDQVRFALVQFANDTVFAPSPDDMPLWTQTPVGAIIWQLKSYPMMLARFAKDVLLDDAKMFLKTGDTGYLKRPALFLTIGPAFGAASQAIKDFAQMRGGDDNREAELRNRNLLKFMGYDEKVHGDKNDFLGWYLEGMMAMGGLGLIADLLHATATSADNGAYGQTRWLGAVFGPTVGTLGAGLTMVGGLLDKDEDSNSKERAAWREAIRRVPVAGGMGAVREGAVDMIAGESSSNRGGDAWDNSGWLEADDAVGGSWDGSSSWSGGSSEW